MAQQTIQIADKPTLDTVNANVSSVKTSVSTVQSGIGATADTGGSATEGSVMGKLNALLSSGEGPIKSIQIGYITGATGATIDVTIEEVDITKSFILVNGFIAAGGEAGSQPLYLLGVTNTTLTFKGHSSKSVSGTYQVIEFY